MDKICTFCKASKPLEDFFKHKNKHDGVQSYCKSCSKSRCRTYYQADKSVQLQRNKDHKKHITNVIIEHLRSHPCVDCGEADIVVLEFDHVRGKKTLAISLMRIRGYSEESVLAEIKKCDVRCANCHRRKTALAGNWSNR